MRRSSQDPLFAKSRINKLAPEIQALADRMCRRLQDDFAGKDKPISLKDMFTSFVGDVTTFYSFNRDFQYLKDPNFQSPFTREIRRFLAWFIRPAAKGLRELQEAMDVIIRQAKRDVLEAKFDPTKTAMHGILSSTLPSSEKRDEVLIDQAAGLVAAGILPYLNTYVEEAIRLACGQTTRSPRISHLPMRYGSLVIPPGTQISMDTWHMHHNEVIYPESFAFVPERWTGDARAPDGKPLKYYMVAFGKGARNCLGMNLARATIRITLGSRIRRFHFEMVDTSYDMDVEIVRDVAAPDTHPESLGVRVLVTYSLFHIKHFIHREASIRLLD
ncbi:cytochrome P450 [Karstenula rhodostoma CBS 690.94]|uniref:Cytochrome P450 n=1 Tax=Karstenula rhodostoma CBS 690.94 TaxID=1392251 RepID=A0A9P4U594_9PLEO|nr:cytochrome P450 [Karstenula rhodostoma CBS 690.94]